MNKEILQYKGYDNFKCIADKCKYTCCSGWQINVDEQTFAKYKKNMYLKINMKDKFVISKKGTCMRLTKDKNCKFLRKDYLCDIHVKFGEGMLCETCKVYPRGVNQLNNSVEKHLYSSCPAMVELFLAKNEKLSFETIEASDTNFSINKKLILDNEIQTEVFWSIRIATIEILQAKDFSIEEKLVLIGLLYKKIKLLLVSNKFEKINDAINLYKEVLKNKDLMPDISSISPKHIIKKLTMISLAKLNLIDKLLDKVPKLDKVLNNYDENGVIDHSLEKKFHIFKEENNIFIENYLVNTVYSTLMPNLNGDIIENYIFLVVKYLILKVYLMSVENVELTKQDFSDIVALSSRTIDHNKGAIEKIINNLKKGTDESGAVAVLVNLM